MSAELDRMWKRYEARHGQVGPGRLNSRADVYRDRIQQPAELIAKSEGITFDQAVDRLLRERPELHTEYANADGDDVFEEPVGEREREQEPDLIAKRALAKYPDLDEPQAVDRYLDTEEGAELYGRLYRL